MSAPAIPKKKLTAIADRMMLFFAGSGLKFASQKVVEKWAKEIKQALKEKE